MITADNRRKHPSGRPKPQDRFVRRSIAQVPYDRPLTPGLNRKLATELIGFRLRPARDDNGDDNG